MHSALNVRAIVPCNAPAGKHVPRIFGFMLSQLKSKKVPFRFPSRDSGRKTFLRNFYLKNVCEEILFY